MASSGCHDDSCSGQSSPQSGGVLAVIPCVDGASKPSRANRSKALKYFKKIEGDEFSCILCHTLKNSLERTVNRNKYKSTTTFWRHLRKFHRQVHDELKGEEKVKRSEAEIFEKSSSVKKFHSGLDLEQSKEEIVRFICLSDSSWSIISKKYFIRLLRHFAQGDFDVPTVKAVKAKAKKLYLEMKDSIMGKLVHVDQVSLTLNAWTSENDISFLGITVHWVDAEWALCEQVIAINRLTAPQTGENMCNNVLQVLDEFELQSKVCAVTTDNASNNKTMITALVAALKRKNPHFNSGRHILCLAHVINLVIQDGMRSMHVSNSSTMPIIIDESDINEMEDPCLTTLGDAIARLRDIVNWVWGSTQNYERYADLCHGFKLQDTNKVPLDCPTQWNSTYDMLVAAIKKKDVLDVISVNVYNRVSISRVEWDMLEEFVNVLQPLEKVTQLACKSKAPMSNEGIALLTVMTRHLDSVLHKISSSTIFHLGGSILSEQRTYIYKAFDAMKTKLSKYVAFLHRNQAFAIAALVDPSLQLRLIDPSFHSEVLAHVRILLDASTGANSDMGSNGNTANWSSNEFLREAIDALLPGSEQTCTVSPALELDSYLDSPASRGTEPLHWWKTTGQHSYPKLAKIAKGFLSVCVSSAPTERFSSSCYGVFKHKRCVSTMESVELLMTLKCWWEAEAEDLNVLDQDKDTKET